MTDTRTGCPVATGAAPDAASAAAHRRHRPRHHLWRHSIPTAALLLASACGQGGDAGHGTSSAEPLVRDSAGIRIIEIFEKALEAATRIRLAEVPDYEIGMVDGPAEQLFGFMGDRVLLSDGGAAVVAYQAGEIRVFGPDGSYEATGGHLGEGPGEFSRTGPELAVGPGDSLWAWDTRAQRLSLFTRSGGFVRGFPVEMPRGGLWGALGDGRPVFRRNRPLRTDDLVVPLADTMAVIVLSPDGAAMDTLLRFPETVRIQPPLGGDPVAPEPVISSSFSAVDDGFWLNLTGNPAVSRYDSRGEPEVIVRWTPGELEMTDELEDRFRVLAFSNVERLRATRGNLSAELFAQMEDDARNTVYADRLPAAFRILARRGGGVAIQRYDVPMDSLPTDTWYLVYPEGPSLQVLEIPADWFVNGFDAGSALVLVTDELGVQHVRRYRLEPG